MHAASGWIGEALGLDRGDVGWDTAQLTVTGNKGRTLKVPPSTSRP
ncbi:hypothetical protein FRAHR75_670039 [Frankia sp. Hr75.2]|nr:hypothetical protein FRAHR75_670039 [Frankia sp. Hr75.2]SQD99484.1 hypothetical protein FMEAI12_5300005 [Parafrankia sp. Ea1.12]